ncbi:nicotinate-nucleotide--dimethylbenzimidazole phosphoribosyltransferase [Nonomuraea sp. NPDC004297]
MFAETLAAIHPADPGVLAEARAHQDRLTKPRGSLGVLEEVAVRLAGAAGVSPPPVPEPAAQVVGHLLPRLHGLPHVFSHARVQLLGGGVHRDLGIPLEQRVGPLLEQRAIAAGHPQQLGDDDHGQRIGQVGHELEPLPIARRVQQLVRERGDPGLEIRDDLAGEGAADELAKLAVLRRVDLGDEAVQGEVVLRRHQVLGDDPHGVGGERHRVAEHVEQLGVTVDVPHSGLGRELDRRARSGPVQPEVLYGDVVPFDDVGHRLSLL